MKPTTRVPEEVFSKILDERTKDLNTKLDEISAKMTAKPKEEKIEEIIQKMKDKIPERIIKKPAEKVVVEEPVKEHVDVFCPSCQKGHIHKMENDGLKMKCTDETCGEELFIIPKSADHTCSNCGFPIKKPVDEKLIEGCPFCHNKKAVPFSNGKPEIKFDFSKMKK